MLLFQQAASAGHTRAMINLANMYDYGDGVQKNGRLACTWSKQALDLGDLSAQQYYDKFKTRYEKAQLAVA